MAAEAAVHARDQVPTAAQAFAEHAHGLGAIEHVAAGEHVDRGIAVLRPGMDRQVRFGDHHHAGDADRAELVERRGDDGGVGLAGGLEHAFLDPLDIVEALVDAVEQLDDQLLAEHGDRIESQRLNCHEGLLLPFRRGMSSRWKAR